MEKVIIGDAVINRARIVTDETEEKRRIAALEDRVNQLSSMVSQLQCMITTTNN